MARGVSLHMHLYWRGQPAVGIGLVMLFYYRESCIPFVENNFKKSLSALYFNLAVLQFRVGFLVKKNI